MDDRRLRAAEPCQARPQFRDAALQSQDALAFPGAIQVRRSGAAALGAWDGVCRLDPHRDQLPDASHMALEDGDVQKSVSRAAFRPASALPQPEPYK